MATQSEDSNRHPWKQSAWKNRQALSDALAAIPTNYSTQRSVAANEYHELAQTYLFEYYGVFEPKKDQFGGDVDPAQADNEELEDNLWWEPVTAVDVPVDGGVRLNGSADVLDDNVADRVVLSEVIGKLSKKRVTVCLGNLPPLYQSENTFQITVQGWVPNQGPVERTIGERRYLPVHAIRELRGQLDRCLEAAGWLPQIGSDVEEWSYEVVEEDDGEA